MNNKLPPPLEDSEYSLNNKDYGEFVKVIVLCLTSVDVKSSSTKGINQLQTGGIGTKDAQRKDVAKTWSFCTELNTMMSNIITLLGIDMSKNLFVLLGAKKILQNMVNDIMTITDYASLQEQVHSIINFFNIAPGVITLISDFDFKQYVDDDRFTFADGPYVYMLGKDTNEDVKRVLFDYILYYIDDRYKTNAETLDNVKKYVSDIFNDALAHVQLNEYCITSIDMLCLNLSDYDVLYKPSLIKIFEVLYKETFGDIPEDARDNVKPYKMFIDNVIMPRSTLISGKVKTIKLSRLIDNLITYFRNVFSMTVSTTIESIDKANILTVTISVDLFNQLADITMNLLVHIARNIANNLLVNLYTGCSTRTQFVHVLNALYNCAPKTEIFNLEQRSIFHYSLLCSKILQTSLDIIEGRKEKGKLMGAA